MDTTDSCVALVSSAANAVDVNAEMASKVLNAADKSFFLSMLKPPLILFSINKTNQKRLL
jgi:hypothetical protein